MAGRKFGLKDCQEFAENKGGLCLANEYDTVVVKMPWKCSVKEHKVWYASFHRVKNHNNWCPECAKISYNKKKKKS